MKRGEASTGIELGQGEPFARYRLYGRIASGGMATVYLGREPERERWVAVKRVHPHLAVRPEVVRMFLNEARLLSRLTHPNICGIVDFGVEEEAPYIVMSYLHGAPFSSVLKRLIDGGAALPVDLMAAVAAQVCAGLHYAHEALGEDGRPLGLVHRDISPQNIFICFDGGVQLLDFGVAKASGFPAFTRTGHIKGKYAYMSPEQVGAAPLDRRSDLFSLGIVLWESLSGRHLFRKKRPLDTLRAIHEARPPPVSQFNPLVPPELEAILRRALMADRRLRFQSALEMGAELEAYLARRGSRVDAVAVGELMVRLFPERKHPAEAQGQITQPEVLGLATEPEGELEEPAEDEAPDDTLPLQALEPARVRPQILGEAPVAAPAWEEPPLTQPDREEEQVGESTELLRDPGAPPLEATEMIPGPPAPARTEGPEPEEELDRTVQLAQDRPDLVATLDGLSDAAAARLRQAALLAEETLVPPRGQATLRVEPFKARPLSLLSSVPADPASVPRPPATLVQVKAPARIWPMALVGMALALSLAVVLLASRPRRARPELAAMGAPARTASTTPGQVATGLPAAVPARSSTVVKQGLAEIQEAMLSGDLSRAERLLLRCVKLREEPLCYRNLGVLYANTDPAASRKAYLRYLALAPGAPDAARIREMLRAGEATR